MASEAPRRCVAFVVANDAVEHNRITTQGDEDLTRSTTASLTGPSVMP